MNGVAKQTVYRLGRGRLTVSAPTPHATKMLIKQGGMKQGCAFDGGDQGTIAEKPSNPT
jgi:hypothetical protein